MEIRCKIMSRPSKNDYFIGIALSVARRSPCLRKMYGAVIVKGDDIVGTGYNGPAKGVVNCSEIGCVKNVLNQPSYSNYEYCPAVHAEENAIINSNREDRIGSRMYVAGYNSDGSYTMAMPCMRCRRKIINAEIAQVIILTEDGGYRTIDPKSWVKDDSDWYKEKYLNAKRGKL